MTFYFNEKKIDSEVTSTSLAQLNFFQKDFTMLATLILYITKKQNVNK